MSRSSESSIDINFENSEAFSQTTEMESKLRNILNTKFGSSSMEGGAKKRGGKKASKKASKGSKKSKKSKASKKSKGSKKAMKGGENPENDPLVGGENPENDPLVGGKKKRGAKKSSKPSKASKASKKSKGSKKSMKGGENPENDPLVGGKKKRAAKKASKGSKKSKKSKKSMKRELPPALKEFQKIIAHVASKTGKGGRPAMVIASSLKKAVEATHGKGKLSAAEVAKKAIELYNSNPSKFTA